MHNWQVHYSAFDACITAHRLTQRGEEFDVYEYTYTDRKGVVSDWRAYAILGKGKDISEVNDPHVTSADHRKITLGELVGLVKLPLRQWHTDRFPETIKWVEEYIA